MSEPKSPGIVKAGEHVLACAHHVESDIRVWAWLGRVRKFAYGVRDSGDSGEVDTQWIVMCVDCHGKYDEMSESDNVLAIVDKIIQFKEDHKLADSVQA